LLGAANLMAAFVVPGLGDCIPAPWITGIDTAINRMAAPSQPTHQIAFAGI